MEKSTELLVAKCITLGVKMYERGQIQDAATAFADALSMARHILEKEDGIDTVECRPKGPFEPKFCKGVQTPLATNGLSVFLNPIASPEDLPQARLRTTLSLIATFNLAICHHRMAADSQLNEGTLRKALRLYELAYAIQMHEGIDMSLSPTMIIMSNVGHIHKLLGNEENATECFQQLLSTLMFLVEAGERDVVSDFDGFFDNVMKTLYANAPAAAA
eukprot:Nitzschia sp. Nitz4//scaffold114_size70088//49341//49994//NITZ4_005983-RA/size70088-processed-gene-0.24-mRNA-1//1//CDS//3329533441//6000//frame0